MRLSLLACLAVFLFVSACGVKRIQTDSAKNTQSPAWINHKAKIANINNWQISGRFGAQSETESWHGSIQWVQKVDQYDILISGPLNSGSLSLKGSANQSTLKMSKNKIFHALDPELLLENHTGLRLPINNLRYWLLGTPSPLSTNKEIIINHEGLLDKLTQVGWEITFKNYTTINDVILPKKIFLENEEFDVRLVIQQWQLI